MIYKPTGVCSKEINIELDGDVIKSVKFTGGCSGNTQGVAALVAGMKVSDAIRESVAEYVRHHALTSLQKPLSRQFNNLLP